MSGHFEPAVEEAWFLLSQVEDTAGLLAQPAFAHSDMETARAALDAAADFTREVVVPLGPAGDAEGCRLEGGRVRTPRGFPEAYRAWSAAGWPGFDLPLPEGGQALPLGAQVALAEMVNGASVAFGMLALQQRSAAHLLIGHADAALRERILPLLLAGEWVATICITEPEAGSDVGRIRTLAVPQADGSYALSGSKMFITFGDSDCAERTVHLALARTPGAPPGTPGISLFALPSLRFADDAPNGITVLRIEHKMGLRASPTCALALEGAIGHRIGAEGQGLKCLFTMMNLMRLEVAVQGVALAEAATQRALAYAAERRQGGAPDAPPVPITQHADVQRMLLTMQARTRAMRALVVFTAGCLDRARVAASMEERNAARGLAELLLPVCKTGGAEGAFEIANLGVQVFGGHGYVSDHGVEQIVRDCRVMAIYEGTSGIQALDLLGRKVLREQGQRYRLLAGAIRADLDRHADDASLATLRDATAAALTRLDACTAGLAARSGVAPREIEWAATDYLQFTALVCGAWMWLRMAAAARDDSAESALRRRLAAFNAAWLLPQIGLHEARIALGEPPGS